MWRLLHSPASTGADNMAMDEALMDHASRTGHWVLRVYSWSAPTLSFGRNQTALGAYDRGRLAERGVDVVRRPTGGRAILHDREVTYSVVGPALNAGDLGESYARINRLLIAALRRLGLDAEVVDRTDPALKNPELERRGPLPCFHHPSAGEITLHGRKLVGSAQWRCSDALLQHGSILVDDDQVQLASLATVMTGDIPKPATLRDALRRAPSESEVAQVLFDAVRDLEDSSARELELDQDLLDRANILRQHYLDDGWTWRR
jgi:lipoyl(octanoyl) transferase